MKLKKVKLATFLFLGIGLAGLQAQTSISATGGNGSGSGGSVSYSVGQVVYSTFTNANGLVTQGVQQPFEISVITAIEEAEGIKLLLSVYPNPTVDFITLRADDFELSDLFYQLYNTQGNLLQNRKVEGIETKIDMNILTPATYILKVIDNNKTIKTFKIIKN